MQTWVLGGGGTLTAGRKMNYKKTRLNAPLNKLLQ